jgi:hypothetical protein
MPHDGSAPLYSADNAGCWAQVPSHEFPGHGNCSAPTISSVSIASSFLATSAPIRSTAQHLGARRPPAALGKIEGKPPCTGRLIGSRKVRGRHQKYCTIIVPHTIQYRPRSGFVRAEVSVSVCVAGQGEGPGSILQPHACLPHTQSTKREKGEGQALHTRNLD